MFGNGPLYILAGLACLSAPFAMRYLPQAEHTQDTASPEIRSTQAQKEASCVKDSVQIAGVWVGCKAREFGREEKKKPGRLKLDSAKTGASAGTGSRFIKLD